MNGAEVLRIVDAIHRDKNIDKEIVFEGIEQAILSAARKHFGEEYEIIADINRESGEPSVELDGEDLESEVLGDLLGRIAAQTAKQVMIQKIREAERDSIYEEFDEMRGDIVTGAVSRFDGGVATVNLGKIEGILPKSEQIPGEGHRVGERVRAVVIDVRKAGSRVKIILSRTHPDLVLRLFQLEIPEVGEGVIELKSLAREAGYRSKVAVSCFDSKIDAVGACVGVRGARIKNIVEELGGERIDIVRWNDSLQVLVPNAMQPAEVEDVILCPMLGRVIVLVRDDQLSLAIGKRGQNVRLASKLVGWDIEVMTRDELDEQLDKSVSAFASVPEVTEELAENLVAQGFFSFYDLSVIEPDQLAELGGLTEAQCNVIVEYADEASVVQEREEAVRRAAAHAARQAAAKAAAEEAAAPATETSTAQASDSEENATDEAEEVTDEAIESASAEEETAEEETAEEETAEEETAEEETAEEETSEEETSEEETSEEETSEEETSDAEPTEQAVTEAKDDADEEDSADEVQDIQATVEEIDATVEEPVATEGLEESAVGEDRAANADEHAVAPELERTAGAAEIESEA